MPYFTVKLINKKVIKNTCFLNSSSLYNQVHTRESISCRIPTGMCNVQLTCTLNAVTLHDCATDTTWQKKVKKCKLYLKTTAIKTSKELTKFEKNIIYLWMLNIKWQELTTSVRETCKNFLCIWADLSLDSDLDWLVSSDKGTINIKKI